MIATGDIVYGSSNHTKSKIVTAIWRVKNRLTRKARLYDYRQTLYYGSDNEFSSIWNSSGVPYINASLEYQLSQEFPSEFREVMLRVASDLENEAKKIRDTYPEPPVKAREGDKCSTAE